MDNKYDTSRVPELGESCADCGGPLFLHPSIGGVCAAFKEEESP